MNREQAIEFLKNYNIYTNSLRGECFLLNYYLRDLIREYENVHNTIIERAREQAAGLSRDGKILLAEEKLKEMQLNDKIMLKAKMNRFEETCLSLSKEKTVETILNEIPSETECGDKNFPENIMTVRGELLQLGKIFIAIREGLEALPAEQRELIDKRFGWNYKWVIIEKKIMKITTYRRKQIYADAINSLMKMDISENDIKTVMEYFNKGDKQKNKEKQPELKASAENLPPEYKNLLKKIYS